MASLSPTLNENLIRAVIRGDAIAVQSLLERGADPDTTGGVTALGASNTALMWAASEGYLPIVKILLDCGANLNSKNAAGYTALMFAAEGDRRDIVLALLDSALLDRTRNLSDRNPYGDTVLIAMARQGQTDIVQRLVAMGAEINATNKSGDTALSMAVDRGHFYTVKALSEIGAALNTENLGGWTPLMMAASQGNLEIISTLLNYGADFRPKNHWGATALSEAHKSFRAQQAVALLKQAGATE